MVDFIVTVMVVSCVVMVTADYFIVKLIMENSVVEAVEVCIYGVKNLFRI